MPWAVLCCQQLELINPLMSALVKPLLEDRAQFWAHQCKRDMDILEGVQVSATEITKVLENHS